MQDISLILDRIKAGDMSVLDELPQEEADYVRKAINELFISGRSVSLDTLYIADYEQIPVSIDEFIDDRYYLGKIGVDIFDSWRKELRLVNEKSRQINCWVIRSSVGAGKTSIGVIEILYKIYSILCLRDPQRFLGQQEGSPIVVGLFNVFKYLAESSAYQYLNNWMKLSPFFRDILPRRHGHRNELRSEYVDLPKGIKIALGSSAIHALSQNLLFSLLDETDISTKTSISNRDKTQIEDLYGQTTTRMLTRFLQSGQYNPTLSILISQVKDTDSFLSRHVEKTKDDPTTYLTGFPIWVAKPHVYKDEPLFKVAIGNKTIDSYVIEDGEEEPDSLQVIEVPVSLRKAFEYDTDDAIRDLAAIPTYGYRLLFPRRDKFYSCLEQHTKRDHPFSRETITLSLDDDTQITDYFLKDNCLVDSGIGQTKPIWYPSSTRAIHIDLAKNKDAAGFAMGCIGEVRNIERFDLNGKPYNVTDYTIFIDIKLRIKAKKGSEIDFSKINSFVFYLISCGFPIKYISFDQYQSVASQQLFTKVGYDVDQLSMDKTVDPYYCLKSTVLEGRLDFYQHQIFIDEFTKLQDNSDIKGASPKIDHPKGKGASKDVCDSVCGVVWRLSKERYSQSNVISAEAIEALTTSTMAEELSEIDKVKDTTWLKKDIVSKNPLEALFEDDNE